MEAPVIAPVKKTDFDEGDRGRDRQIREDKEVDAARQSGDRRAGRSRAAWRWRERPTCVW